MDERWLPVPDYVGLYEVSNRGRVRSLDRTVRRGRGHVRICGVDLKMRLTPDGYQGVVLHKDGKPVDRLVHVLMLTAFRGPRPSGKQTRHLDGKPAHNWDTNLEWGTASENAHDRVAHGTHPQARKECCDYDHPLQLPNLVANALRAGKRQCKACHWTYAARSRAKRRNEVFDFRTVADAYHARILASAA